MTKRIAVLVALLGLLVAPVAAQERPSQRSLALLGCGIETQDDPDSISITPPLWLESKFMKWDGAAYEYLVEGWWFTDNEFPGHHVGDWRTFPVTRDVFWDQVLVLDAQGRMTKRLCRLGFIDGFPIATAVTCVNGTQYWLPLTIK